MAKNKENEVLVNENDAVEEVVVEKKTAAKKQAHKFAPDDMIPCRSVTYGELLLEGFKTKALYTWANEGDVTEVEFQDLQALQSRKSRFLTDPLFIIEDEDLVSNWSSMLKPIYSRIEEANLEELLQLPVTKLKNKLKASPDGVKSSVKSMVAAKILTGEFDSLNRIKAIDEVLGTQLISMIQ